MKALSIRNVPDDVYYGLQKMAKNNRRSLQEQVRLLLEQEVKLTNGSSMARASEWRIRLKNRRFSDTVQNIREDRER